MKKLMACFLVFVVSVAMGLSQSKPVVVVAPFDAKGFDEDDMDVITEVFISEYANTKKADVVDRNSFDKIKSQLDFQSSDWSNADKVAEMGKALNANQVVVGQFRKISSGKILVIIRVEDVNSTKILSSVTPQLNALLDALEKIPDWCKQLATEASGDKFVSSANESKSVVAKSNSEEKKPSATSGKQNKVVTAPKQVTQQPKKEVRYKDVKVDDGWGLGKGCVFWGLGFAPAVSGCVLALLAVSLDGDADGQGKLLVTSGVMVGAGGCIMLLSLLIPNEYHYEKKQISQFDNGNALKNLNIALAPNVVSVGYTLHL